MTFAGRKRSPFDFVALRGKSHGNFHLPLAIFAKAYDYFYRVIYSCIVMVAAVSLLQFQIDTLA